ncbi:hypothetical protein CFREI_01560 [Corynebacterium freiburgense]|nr:hypothetical protein CFREI_01560 [Corynebacterium freiburgense]
MTGRVWLCTTGDLGFGWGLWGALGLFGRWLGAGWACCHRFHFFGRFYGICDTIGREPVTDSIIFRCFSLFLWNLRQTPGQRLRATWVAVTNSIFSADFMESATLSMKTYLV